MKNLFTLKNSQRLRLTILAGLMIGIAFLIPHLFDGHLLIDKKYAQSAVILLYSSISFIISYQFLKDIHRISEEKKYSEKLLDNTYKYLGVTNRKIDILKDFITIMADKNVDSRRIIESLTKYLVYSITKSSNGILRFIDRNSAKTLTEWNILDDNHKTVKISNKAILNGGETGILDVDFQYRKSTLAYTKVECAFIFDSDCKDFDNSFLAILLAQVHSLTILQKLLPYTELKKTNTKWWN